MTKYVWLNLQTGEFSNSWNKSEYKEFDKNELDDARKNDYVLIKYECLNSNHFKFINLMKLITNSISDET